MLKQILIGFCVLVFCGAFALAQEKPNNNNVDEMKVLKKETLAWNKVCPVDGKPVNQNVAKIVFNEKSYGFCSEKCSESFKSNPKLYSQNLSDDGTKFINKEKEKSKTE
jgi:YHS domain-containing protein